MSRAHIVTFLCASLSALLVGGCFDAPRPVCAFLCGTAGECPADYACGDDSRCHLVAPDDTLMECEDTVFDAALPDVAEPDAPPLNPTYLASITVEELSWIANTTDTGVKATIDFRDEASDDAALIYDQNPATDLDGCEAYLFDASALPGPGLDEGVVSIVHSGATTTTLPDCHSHLPQTRRGT